MSEKEEDHTRPAEKQENTAEGSKPGPFTSLVRGIGNLIDLVASMDDEKSEERREGEITDPSGRLKAAFKFSIKSALTDEALEFESPSRVKEKPARSKPTVEEEVQPLVDVFDEGDHVLLIIELPAVEEKNIHIEVNGDILAFTAASKYRKYAGEVVLPDDIDGSTVTSKYKNSVLEIRMNKKFHDSNDHPTESRRSKSS
jgi:HSP20 family protein